MDELICRIRMLLAFDISLSSIHDEIVRNGVPEELFFLCYQAALVLDNDSKPLLQ